LHYGINAVLKVGAGIAMLLSFLLSGTMIYTPEGGVTPWFQTTRGQEFQIPDSPAGVTPSGPI
jgi:hypothetical protein